MPILLQILANSNPFRGCTKMYFKNVVVLTSISTKNLHRRYLPSRTAFGLQARIRHKCYFRDNSRRSTWSSHDRKPRAVCVYIFLRRVFLLCLLEHSVPGRRVLSSSSFDVRNVQGTSRRAERFGRANREWMIVPARTTTIIVTIFRVGLVQGTTAGGKGLRR